MGFPDENDDRVKQLISTCKKRQVLGGKTYDPDFVEALAEIYTYYRDYCFSGMKIRKTEKEAACSGAHTFTMISLSRALNTAGVKSCRGIDMNSDILDYIYKHYLADRVGDCHDIKSEKDQD